MVSLKLTACTGEAAEEWRVGAARVPLCSCEGCDLHPRSPLHAAALHIPFFRAVTPPLTPHLGNLCCCPAGGSSSVSPCVAPGLDCEADRPQACTTCKPTTLLLE